MHKILEWGIEVILWLQQASPALDWPMRFITALGSGAFLASLAIVFYWNIDHRIGARLLVLLVFSSYVNVAAKAIFNQPRPYMFDHRVLMLSSASGGGLPSGHTQAATVIWVYLALAYRQRRLWIVTAVMLILVPLSRLYLGVHFPTDLLGGFIIGLALVALWQVVPALERWLERRRILWSLLLVGMLPILAVLSLSYGDDAFLLLGAGTGFCLGLCYQRRWLHFRCQGSPRQKLRRIFVGAAPVLVFSLADILPTFRFLDIPIARFIWYTLLGLWLALGAPWLFQRLGLAHCVADQ